MLCKAVDHVDQAEYRGKYDYWAKMNGIDNTWPLRLIRYFCKVKEVRMDHFNS